MMRAIGYDHRSVVAEDESAEIILGQPVGLAQHLLVDSHLHHRPEAWPGMIVVKARFRMVLWWERARRYLLNRPIWRVVYFG